jgi:glycosyltransferase involved in cell wall biosynthesis
MSDGAGALQRYARVPGHAVATFVAMRKIFKKFPHPRTDSGGLRADWRVAPEDRRSEIGDRGKSGATALDARRSTLDASPALDSGRWSLDSGEAPDWIFVPTVLVHHLLGWSLLIKSGAVPKGARVLLFFPNLPIRLDDSRRPYWSAGPTTKLMAWLFGQLRQEVESGRVVLGVETHAMRRALENLIGMRVVYLPHPVQAKQAQGESRVEGRESSGTTKDTNGHEKLTTEDTESAEDRFVQKQGGAWSSQAGAAFSNPSTSELARDSENPSPTRFASIPASSSPATSNSLPATAVKPLVFGCYGAARWEKGSDIFQEAIKLILSNEVVSKKWRVASLENEPQLVTRDPLPATATGRPLRFAIQWVEDFRDREGNLISIDPWLREHPQVEVIGRYFQGDEYERRLATTDVMVLPYRSPYRLRVSRVVIEAMMHGMPVVTTKGTTLYEQAYEHGVVMCCEEGSAESLALAILEFAEVFAAMREAAEKKAEKAAESFSVGYFRKLLGKPLASPLDAKAYL